ncbi:MAG: SurA N-terminal domain-containing protein [Neomegalonema sp.]
MLELLRSAVKSWVAKLLLGLLVLSFAAWGVGDMFSGRVSSVAATVDGEDITTVEFRREFDETLRQLQGLDVMQASAMGLPQIVLTQLALDKALDQEARSLGVAASDQQVFDAIRDQPAFLNVAGQFDEDAYRAALRFNGMRPADFEEQIRGEIARGELQQAVAAGASAPRSAQEAIWKRLNERRNLQYLVIDEGALSEPAAPTEAELTAFHQDNAARFSSPEYRQISYLWLRPEDLASGETVTDDDARAMYEERADLYQSPERRNLEQIVFDDEASAQAALSRIEAGESFEKIASERGLSAADIALGYVARENAPADLVDAAFGLKTDGVVGPVETAFGWTLVNLRGLIEAEVTPFEEALEERKREVALDRARDALPDLANAVEDLRAAGATLVEVGEKENATSGIVIVDRDGYDQSGARVQNLPPDPGFLDRVISTEIGDEMDLADAADGGFFAMIVEEVLPTALRPIDTVRDRVEAAYAAQARRDALGRTAQDAVEALATGGDLATLADEFGADLATIESLGRNDARPEFPAPAVEAAFDVQEGQAFERPTDGGRQRVIAVVTDVIEADLSAGAAEIELLQEQASGAIALDLLEIFRRAALEQREVETNQTAVSYSLGLTTDGQPHSGMGGF